MDKVKPCTSVNLDKAEWSMLTYNFMCIKAALAGKKDALCNVFTPPSDDPNTVKLYRAEWFANGKQITNSESGQLFFTRENAENDAI